MKPSKIRLTSDQNESFESMNMNIVELNSVNCFRKWRVFFLLLVSTLFCIKSYYTFELWEEKKTFKTKLGKKICNKNRKEHSLENCFTCWKLPVETTATPDDEFFRLLRKIATPSKSTADNSHQRIADLFKL